MIHRRHFRFPGNGLKDILSAFMYQNGTESIGNFERAFARYTGTLHAVAVPSGRSGLSLILSALGIKPGGEILMTAYTLKDLTVLMRESGYLVRHVDIDPQTFNLD